MNFSIACFIGQFPIFLWQSSWMRKRTNRRPAVGDQDGAKANRLEQMNYGLGPTGVAASSGSGCGGAAGVGSGASCSQSQPSLMQECNVPILLRFSTIKGAPHF